MPAQFRLVIKTTSWDSGYHVLLDQLLDKMYIVECRNIGDVDHYVIGPRGLPDFKDDLVEYSE